MTWRMPYGTGPTAVAGLCNASKCNAEVVSWLYRRSFDERAFLLRHAEVREGLNSAAASPMCPLPSQS